MKAFFSRMFRTATQTRRNSSRPRRLTSLGVETLDQRLLPSVTAFTSNGVLQITGDAGTDNGGVRAGVDIVQLKPGTAIAKKILLVTDTFADTGKWETRQFDATGISKITFKATGGTHGFANDTDLPMEADGRGIAATFVGGSGDDVFWVDGNDKLYPREGNNVTFGLVGGKLTPEELGASGSLSAMLNGQTLTLSGPGGAGFQIVGNWQNSWALAETFTASGNLTLKTALGDVPFYVPAATPLTVKTNAETTFWNAGVVSGDVTMTGLPNLSVNDTGVMKAFKDQLGLDLSLPSVSWGLKMGSGLGSLNLPVNAGVPYLYASVNSNFTAQMGGISVQKSLGPTMAVAFDPADPSLVVRSGDFAVGGSVKGYIPFAPRVTPTEATGPIFGNIFAAGAVQLGSYPITVDGDIVIGLDANRDGNLVGMSGNTLPNLLNGTLKVSDLALNAINDVAIGVNGGVALSYSKFGFDLGVDAGSATVMYTPGKLALRGQQNNPFEGTVLDNLVPPSLQDTMTGPRYSVDGSISWSRTGVENWHITAGVDNLVLGGSFRATHADFTIANTGITANVNVEGLLGLASLNMSGSVDYSGNFTLTTHAGLSFDAKVTTINAGVDFTLSNAAGYVKFDAHLYGGVYFNYYAGTVNGNLDAHFSIWKDGTGIHFSGDGSVTGSYTVGWSGGSLNQYFTVGDHGFTVVMPSIVPNFSVSW